MLHFLEGVIVRTPVRFFRKRRGRANRYYRASLKETEPRLIRKACYQLRPEVLPCLTRASVWGFFRRRSAILCEGDQQYCDSDQESERSDAGSGIVSEVIEMVKEKV